MMIRSVQRLYWLAIDGKAVSSEATLSNSNLFEKPNDEASYRVRLRASALPDEQLALGELLFRFLRIVQIGSQSETLQQLGTTASTFGVVAQVDKVIHSISKVCFIVCISWTYASNTSCC